MSRLHEPIKLYFKLGLRHEQILNLVCTLDEIYIYILSIGYYCGKIICVRKKICACVYNIHACKKDLSVHKFCVWKIFVCLSTAVCVKQSWLNDVDPSGSPQLASAHVNFATLLAWKLFCKWAARFVGWGVVWDFFYPRRRLTGNNTENDRFLALGAPFFVGLSPNNDNKSILYLKIL